MTVARALRVLEVETSQSWIEIRQSYRDLVRVWHPDRFEGDPRLRKRAQVRLAQINDAYRFLQQQHITDPAGQRQRRRMPPRSGVTQPAVQRRRGDLQAVRPARVWAGRLVVTAAVLTLMALAMSPRVFRRAPILSAAPAPGLEQGVAGTRFANGPARPDRGGGQNVEGEAPRRAARPTSFIDRETAAVLERIRE